MVANLPIIFPSAISFRIFHIKHHLYQGELDRDADLPRQFEVDWVGNSSIKKAIWYLCYFLPQMFRVPCLKGIQIFNRWVALNWVTEVTFLVAVTYFTGWGAFAYLALSSIFSIGLHPVGARWIQEHFVVHEKQETYSYYGPLNKVAFNVGYHNEHHDLMRVPWSRLPQVRAAAPEMYDTLYYHMSWSGLLVRFIMDPKLGLFSRVTRPAAANAQTAAKVAKSPKAPIDMENPLLV
jgi:sphingolipid delta-4 desaturase